LFLKDFKIFTMKIDIFHTKNIPLIVKTAFPEQSAQSALINIIFSEEKK